MIINYTNPFYLEFVEIAWLNPRQFISIITRYENEINRIACRNEKEPDINFYSRDRPLNVGPTCDKSLDVPLPSSSISGHPALMPNRSARKD